MKELVPALWDDLELSKSEPSKVPADQTRFLGWEGQWYELDLTDAHDKELWARIEAYVQAGTKTDTPPKPRKPILGGDMKAAYERNQKVIAWAKLNGYKISPRQSGQGSPYIPVGTQRAYDEAHPDG